LIHNFIGQILINFPVTLNNTFPILLYLTGKPVTEIYAYNYFIKSIEFSESNYSKLKSEKWRYNAKVKLEHTKKNTVTRKLNEKKQQCFFAVFYPFKTGKILFIQNSHLRLRNF